MRSVECNSERGYAARMLCSPNGRSYGLRRYTILTPPQPLPREGLVSRALRAPGGARSQYANNSIAARMRFTFTRVGLGTWIRYPNVLPIGLSWLRRKVIKPLSAYRAIGIDKRSYNAATTKYPPAPPTEPPFSARRLCRRPWLRGVEAAQPRRSEAGGRVYAAAENIYRITVPAANCRGRYYLQTET